jgi:hypothetical protein
MGAGERTRAIRDRTAYRDTMNIAANGGIKQKPRGIVYAGPIALRYKCLGAAVGGNGTEGGTECAAVYIRSASSYSELLSVTRGMYAGHSETHAAANRFTSPPSNGDVLRNVLPATGDANEYSLRHNHLILNTESGSSTQNLLTLTLPAKREPNVGPTNATNAEYDHELLHGVSDAMRCAQFPPDPRISLVYGGYGCVV